MKIISTICSIVLFPFVLSATEISAQEILKPGLLQVAGSMQYNRGVSGTNALNVNLEYGKYVTEKFAFLPSTMLGRSVLVILMGAFSCISKMSQKPERNSRAVIKLACS